MGRKNEKKTGKKRQRNFDEYKGVIEVTRSGMGFVVVPGLETDILVRPNDFNTALHGDTVKVEVNPDKKGGKRMQGTVIDVLERKQLEFVGKLQMNKGFAFFVSEGDKKVPDIFIPQ
ncbi:MAG: ribonuclease R, partial [Flavisolibacter sp.]